MKLFKSVFVTLLMLILSSTILSVSNAGEPGVGIKSFNYLSVARSQIYINTNNTITAKGETGAYTNVDKVAVTVYLEKEEGGSWKVVQSWNNYKNNSSYITCSGTSGNLTSGKYRVRSYHRIDHQGIIEVTTSYTNPQTI